MYSASPARQLVPRMTRGNVLAFAIAMALACFGFAVAAQKASAVFNCITLTPATADNQLPQQSSHTVTATVHTTYDPVGHANDPIWWPYNEYYSTLPQYAGQSQTQVRTALQADYPAVCGAPIASQYPVAVGAPVSFAITSGPNAGQSAGPVLTDANGQATFTWSGATPGTDTVQASVPKNYDAGNNTYYTWQPTPQDNYGPALASAIKNWLPPVTNPPVTPAGAPSSVLTVPKTCQKRKFYIKASTSGGTVKKIVLKIDGKTAKVVKTTKTASGKKFLIDTGKYSAGTHRITLTTYFTNGAKVIKTGKFKLCTVRTSQRRVSPNFTG